MEGFADSIVIEATPEDVFHFLEDPANAAKWVHGLTHVEWLTEPPMRTGSRLRLVRQMGKKEIYAECEVVHHEGPDESPRGPFQHVATSTLLGNRTTCRMTISRAVIDPDASSDDAVAHMQEDFPAAAHVEFVATIEPCSMLGRLFTTRCFRETLAENGEHLQRLKSAVEREFAIEHLGAL